MNCLGRKLEFFKLKNDERKIMVAEIRPVRCFWIPMACKTTNWMTLENWKELEQLVEKILDAYEENIKCSIIHKNKIELNKYNKLVGSSIKIGYTFVPYKKVVSTILTPREYEETIFDSVNYSSKHFQDKGGLYDHKRECDESLIIAVCPLKEEESLKISSTGSYSEMLVEKKLHQTLQMTPATDVNSMTNYIKSEPISKKSKLSSSPGKKSYRVKLVKTTTTPAYDLSNWQDGAYSPTKFSLADISDQQMSLIDFDETSDLDTCDQSSNLEFPNLETETSDLSSSNPEVTLQRQLKTKSFKRSPKHKKKTSEDLVSKTEEKILKINTHRSSELHNFGLNASFQSEDLFPDESVPSYENKAHLCDLNTHSISCVEAIGEDTSYENQCDMFPFKLSGSSTPQSKHGDEQLNYDSEMFSPISRIPKQDHLDFYGFKDGTPVVTKNGDLSEVEDLELSFSSEDENEFSSPVTRASSRKRKNHYCEDDNSPKKCQKISFEKNTTNDFSEEQMSLINFDSLSDTESSTKPGDRSSNLESPKIQTETSELSSSNSEITLKERPKKSFKRSRTHKGSSSNDSVFLSPEKRRKSNNNRSKPRNGKIETALKVAKINNSNSANLPFSEIVCGNESLSDIKEDEPLPPRSHKSEKILIDQKSEPLSTTEELISSQDNVLEELPDFDDVFDDLEPSSDLLNKESDKSSPKRNLRSDKKSEMNGCKSKEFFKTFKIPKLKTPSPPHQETTIKPVKKKPLPKPILPPIKILKRKSLLGANVKKLQSSVAKPKTKTTKCKSPSKKVQNKSAKKKPQDFLPSSSSQSESTPKPKRRGRPRKVDPSQPCIKEFLKEKTPEPTGYIDPFEGLNPEYVSMMLRLAETDEVAKFLEKHNTVNSPIVEEIEEEELPDPVAKPLSDYLRSLVADDIEQLLEKYKPYLWEITKRKRRNERDDIYRMPRNHLPETDAGKFYCPLAPGMNDIIMLFILKEFKPYVDTYMGRHGACVNYASYVLLPEFIINVVLNCPIGQKDKITASRCEDIFNDILHFKFFVRAAGLAT